MEKGKNSPVFLKWAGGKRKILPDLERFFPRKIERYFEPFLGAGSVFFFIKEKYNPTFCKISDVNMDLIGTYRDVRDSPLELIDSLQHFKEKNSKEFYYQTRQDFNDRKLRKIERSAAFIYLNKTCFNGLYRVNSKNEFNVPYGRYENPGIYNPDMILAASKLLQGVHIENQDYEVILSETKRGDFVYLDPCYDPIKKTSFVQYTPERFSENDRLKLFEFIKGLKNKKVKMMLSNNNVPEIRKLYLKRGFKLHKIQTARTLGGSFGRDKIKELAINNY